MTAYWIRQHKERVMNTVASFWIKRRAPIAFIFGACFGLVWCLVSPWLGVGIGVVWAIADVFVPLKVTQ